ncbi:MAG: hypothetical protein F4124_08280 [Acidimicrobiia bacterium]|nr:hypothetical protein [Acidimicrobiia bacterium]MYH99409.1 hypothetical protein [Acidimicrobiia bacterium]
MERTMIEMLTDLLEDARIWMISALSGVTLGTAWKSFKDTHSAPLAIGVLVLGVVATALLANMMPIAEWAGSDLHDQIESNYQSCLEWGADC